MCYTNPALSIGKCNQSTVGILHVCLPKHNALHHSTKQVFCLEFHHIHYRTCKFCPMTQICHVITKRLHFNVNICQQQTDPLMVLVVVTDVLHPNSPSKVILKTC